MAKVRFAAMFGAAAFSAGIVLAAATPTPIAHADGTDTSAATDGATVAGAGATAHPARRPSAVPANAAKPAGARGSGDAPGVGVAVRTIHRGAVLVGIATTDLPTVRPNGAPSAPPREAAAATPATTPAGPTRMAEVVAAPVISIAPAQTSTAGFATTVTAPTPAATVAATTTVPAPVPPARSAPRALAVMTVTPGVSANASSSASLIDNLLAPIRTIFGEGAALLVRRTFFNEAPSLTPVQLTGQSVGPITGTLAAVDPEGDALTYSVTGNPQHGSAVVNGDGSYTYTSATGFSGNDSFIVAVTDTGFHINLLDLFRPASTSASVAVSQGALASNLRFQFVYGTGSQYWSSAARSALESAATQLSSYIVVTSPVTITYDVTGQSSVIFSTLASAGSDFVNDGTGFLPTVVQNKIQTGHDANGSAADGTIDWNFGRSWALGSSVSSSEYDLQSTAMHELLHTFGFLSNIDRAGSNTAPIWTIYDSFVVDAAGTRAINSSDYSWNTAFDPNLTGGNGGLYFGGPHAVAANLGNAKLHTPNPWASGSSISHLSTDTLMKATVSTGPRPRVLSPVDLGVLADIGYTVSPGPGTPALLFVGFVTIRLRRRKG